MRLWILSAIFCVCALSALRAEELILTTYYPAPNGSYDRMRTNRFSVGDTNNDGVVDNNDQPARDGDIRLRPQPGAPSGWPVAGAGQLSYSAMQDRLMISNGSAWVGAGAGKDIITLHQPFIYGYNDPVGWTYYIFRKGTGWVLTSATAFPALSCPRGWTEIAQDQEFSAATSSATSVQFLGIWVWGSYKTICER